MDQILNVSNAITMVVVLTVADIRCNRLWTTLNAPSVINKGTWLTIVGIARFGKRNRDMKTKQITRFH